MERDNLALTKSKRFAVRIINLYKYLCDEKKEFILSKQILKSGTSIGANAREASKAQSKKEFIAKMNISLKEAEETCYWLEILEESNIIDTNAFDSIYADANELVAIFTSIVKTSNTNK